MAPRTSSWSVWNNASSTDRYIRSADDWIEARQKDDGTEGLWRIHDGLYDFRHWIHKHPGGPQWLEITKGTDITELFETYHLNGKAATEVMHRFYVRPADSPRKSPFTFKPDGFYNVLKSRVAKKLAYTKLPNSLSLKSVMVIDCCFFVTLVMCAAVARTENYLLALITGVALALGSVASHNFTHLKDNWRMYYLQLSLFSVREWRISHVVSHHVYTNTVQDLEMTLLYPFIHWFPTKDKPWIVLWLPFLTPIAYIFTGTVIFITRTLKRKNDKADLLIFVIPVIMVFSGRMTISNVCAMWYFIILTCNFVFVFLGFSVSHHLPENFHDGDFIDDQYIDWGIYQMNTSAERSEPFKNNIFFQLVTFGDHTLHHLFPSLDQSLIPLVQNIFEDTCKEFGMDVSQKSVMSIMHGQFKQLVRLTPRHKP
ncbi:Cytochrome b5-like heme/steroid binding domain,Fatty acid desaturase domain [Cinara cedri]|uniref:Cytochrome b5-like heme/steroid binding domain,Fatty acid desaturase domain n=1 Tax=Cinara cedri TaxID=506608 RepID=A0A5E4MNM6_9HEMI|nr:Cytochrome b5-like heme/steroid binding domain,Fatty acid desaturase domain [Cinara cedri]